MSRSYKKHGILKYGTNITKAKANRIFRHRNRQRILKGLDPFQMYELINPWEVNDVWSLFRGEKHYANKIRRGLTGTRLWTDEEILKLKREYFNK